MTKKIKIDFADISFHTDFNSDCGGGGFKWTCPCCEDELSWAPKMWWPLECDCRSWSFDVKITGEDL